MPHIPDDYYQIIDLSLLEKGTYPSEIVSFFHDADRHPRDLPVTVQDFHSFSIVSQLGFKKIKYESQHLQMDDGMAIFWINHEHAASIGKVLNSSIQELILMCSTEEEGAFAVMADQISEGVCIDSLAISHITYDEVTAHEVKGLARLITRLKCRSFTLWAAEYDPEVLDLFTNELQQIKNTTLQQVFIGDSTRESGEDEIKVPVLLQLAASNAR